MMIGRLSTSLLILAAASGPLLAQLTPWEAEGGKVVIHFIDSALEQAGLQLVDLEQTTDFIDPASQELDGDAYGFRILPESDLMALRRPDDNFQPYGVLGGSVLTSGGFYLHDTTTGRGVDLHDFSIHAREVRNDGPAGAPDPDYFFMAPKTEPNFDAFKLCYVKVYFLDGQGYQDPGQGDHELPDRLRIKAWDMIVTKELAERLGRPELEDQILGYGNIEADVVSFTGDWDHPQGQNIFTPNKNNRDDGGDSAALGGGFLDVKLGILSGITSLGRTGVFPNGRNGLSMSTTSCNVGDVNSTWLAPMNEDHPGIAMALFREANGRFEQVAASWIKHGFFALSNSQCTPCQNPSGGQFLGVGCSDTYSSSNNGSRMWLGPRSEWNVFDATWTCLGSFFDGTPVDCVRSNNGSGLGPVRHRLEAQDSDLGNAGATYWYEGYYLVNGDQNLDNNLGSRRTTMSWNGFSWQFSTPGGGNPLVEGPTLLNRWGDKRVKAGLKPHDGNVILSVETTDLGNGQWRYEYALYNWDLDRKIDSFSLPVSGPTFNHYFHDVDFEAATDWKVSTADNTLTWAWDGTMPTTHLEGGALEFGHLYNFGFTSGRPPADRNATLGISEAGLGGDLLAVDTTGPDFFELTASVLSPVEGQNISVDMRGGFDLAVAVVLSVNGTPITPTFLGPAIPFVSGNASIPVTIPSGLSGVCVEVVAADVDAGLNVHQLSNIMELCVQ